MSNETPERSPYPASPSAPIDGGAAGQHAFGPRVSSAPSAVAPGASPGFVDRPAAVPATDAVDASRSVSKGALFGIVGGAVAVVLIVAAAIVVPSLLRGPALSASDVVEDYLTALSEGDAEAALEYVTAYDDALLTDEVLAASRDRAPIADIEVGEAQGTAEQSIVPVSFTIGGEAVSRDFEVWHYGDDWQIYDGLVFAGFDGFDGLGLTVNGVEVGAQTYLFPGSYQLAVSQDQFAVSGDVDTFTVVEARDGEALYELHPVLTYDGAATFRELVRASLQECIAMTSLSTPCGMDIADIDLNGYAPVEGSVTRTLTADGEAALKSLEAEVDYRDPTLVSTWDSIDVDMTLEGEKDGEKAEFEVWFGGYVGTPSVDFSEEDPTVTWEQ